MCMCWTYSMQVHYSAMPLCSWCLWDSAHYTLMVDLKVIWTYLQRWSGSVMTFLVMVCPSEWQPTCLELKLWPNATVPYIINPYLPSDVIRNISIAILIVKIISACNLSQCTPWLYWYTILSVTMFYSLIGVVAASRLGRYGGTQIINLGTYICGQIGVIIL